MIIEKVRIILYYVLNFISIELFHFILIIFVSLRTAKVASAFLRANDVAKGPEEKHGASEGKSDCARYQDCELLENYQLTTKEESARTKGCESTTENADSHLLE